MKWFLLSAIAVKAVKGRCGRHCAAAGVDGMIAQEIIDFAA